MFDLIYNLNADCKVDSRAGKSRSRERSSEAVDSGSKEREVLPFAERGRMARISQN